ncbi:uncharacterized protein ACHE_51157S [Aspergillus chevalieri]|uniref:F-box domain-containing protein n=1 Tax=Aspergillus chevalieri TaxID=182096 RepID=A0A7R7ZQT4_ASPCH|nr:uncharacterized protein ACHE_51157S [Aspergillus chevalieri]BCR89959.1 hypothetical protein ACHE_51157S [Aspergillus chevalieri]
MAAVNRNMFEATVTADMPGDASLMVLPLNLIDKIISYVDDIADLARLCRTCRVLNYMSLPLLYRNLTLTSYDKIRYRGEEPEGVGSASPFSMGLNAVITRPYAKLVRSLTLRGEWREHELEEHARVGRVPDSSMMLNIAVRAAVDRMPDLESFSWELNTKMLETVYLGLAQLPRLTSLNVRFPSSRHPRPTIVIPPMPHLRRLKLTDIDPLCYPDDISTLLWKCKKLKELNMHWSSRMRNAQEPSVMLHDYFRKCISAREPLAVRKIALQNLYALHSEEFNIAFDPNTVEDVTVLNNTGSDGPSFMNTFVDRSWPTNPPNSRLQIKCMRQDALSKRHAEFLANFTGLERLYFVNSPRDANDVTSPRVPSSSSPRPSSDYAYPHSNSPTVSSPNPSNLQLNIRDNYLNAIVTNHASTLRHLLLPSRWPLSASTLARLVHASPNLEQFAFATELSSMETLGLILPFLRKLSALRLLIPTENITSPPNGTPGTGTAPRTTNNANRFASARTLQDLVELDDKILVEKMSVPLADKSIFSNLKVLGVGWKAWELREFYIAEDHQPPSQQRPHTEESPNHYASTPTLQTPTFENGTPNQDLGMNTTSPHSHLLPTTAHPQSGHPNSRQQSTTSILGKRPRDDDHQSPLTTSPTKTRHHQPLPHENFLAELDDNICLPLQTNPDAQRWRRRLRRVGWEVLKDWEIWGLDKQEL